MISDKKKYETEAKEYPYKVKPTTLLNLYKESNIKGKIIGTMSVLEEGTVTEEKYGLGYIEEKKGWVNLSKTKII